MGVSALPVLPPSPCIVHTALQRAERDGQDGPACIKRTVSPAPRGLPVFGSSGKLGMQDFGMESAAHLRQVCLLVFINLFFFFFTGQHQEVVFISFLLGRPPLSFALSHSFPFSESLLAREN